MRVNINIDRHNNFLNAHYLNRTLNHSSSAQKSERQEQKEAVSVSISPLGKANSLVEVLMKQKQQIIENKNDLIGKTLEKGEGMDSIKSQLENYEEQLKDIDAQITQIMTEYSRQETEKQKGITYEAPKTEKGYQTELSNTILGSSSSLNQTQVVSSAKNRIDGEARVLESEIKLDGARGGASTSKKERLAELQKQSANISAQIGEDLVDVNEEIEKRNDNQLFEPEEKG